MKTRKLKKFLTGAAGIGALATAGTSVATTLNAKQEDVYKTIRQNVTGQSRTFSDSWTDVISASGKQHFFQTVVSVGGRQFGYKNEDSATHAPYEGYMEITTTHQGSLDMSEAGLNMKNLVIELSSSQNEGVVAGEIARGRTSQLSPKLYTEFNSDYTVKTINYHIDYHSYVQTEALWFRHSLDTTIVIDSIDYVAKEGSQLWIENITERDSFYEQYTTTIFEYSTYAYLESIVSIGGVNTIAADRYVGEGRLAYINTGDEQEILPVVVNGLSDKEAIRSFHVQSAHAMSEKSNLRIKEFSHQNTVNLSALEAIDTTQFDSMKISFIKETNVLQENRQALYMHILSTGFRVDSIILTV